MASLTPFNGTLGTRLAAHLLRRTTFNITKARIDQYAAMTASTAVDALFNIGPLTLAEPYDIDTGQPWINSGVDPQAGEQDQMRTIVGWWMYEAFQDTSISHKMQFFLHSRWVTSHSDFFDSRQFFDYVALLRFYAIGSYKTLAKKMTLDNMMLDYLDGEDNVVGFPQENYAREFLELFTILKGAQAGPGDYTTYTELDVGEGAKLLSGWERSSRPLGGDPQYFDPDTGITAGYANPYNHDTSNKTFSYAFNNLPINGTTETGHDEMVTEMYRELDDYMDMVFGADETARSICRKLYTYFVSRIITSEIETDIIEPLATNLRNNNYVLEGVVKQLLKSQHFYDADDGNSTDEIIGSLLKSPLELLAHTMSFFQIDIGDPQVNPYEHYKEWWIRSVIQTIFGQGGFSIFQPENVAGYPGYYLAPNFDRNWFDATTILARYKLPDMLLQGKRILINGDLGAGVQMDIVDFVTNSGIVSNPSNAETLLDELALYLLPEPMSTERRDYFLKEVLLDNLTTINWFFEWLNFLNSGDATSVRIQLEKLFRALLFSREYQLM